MVKMLREVGNLKVEIRSNFLAVVCYLTRRGVGTSAVWTALIHVGDSDASGGQETSASIGWAATLVTVLVVGIVVSALVEQVGVLALALREPPAGLRQPVPQLLQSFPLSHSGLSSLATDSVTHPVHAGLQVVNFGQEGGRLVKVVACRHVVDEPADLHQVHLHSAVALGEGEEVNGASISVDLIGHAGVAVKA